MKRKVRLLGAKSTKSKSTKSKSTKMGAAKTRSAKRGSSRARLSKAALITPTKAPAEAEPHAATPKKRWYHNKILDTLLGITILLGVTTIGCDEGAHVAGKHAFNAICAWLSPQLGDEFLDELTHTIDIREFASQPWVGHVWLDILDSKIKLEVTSGKLANDKEAIVSVVGLPTGDHTIKLKESSEHLFKGRAYCVEHGGAVTKEGEAVLILLSDNQIRMTLKLTNGWVYDRVFQRKP